MHSNFRYSKIWKKKKVCISRRRKWHPAPVLLPGKSHGWRTLVGYSPWVAESDVTEQLHSLHLVKMQNNTEETTNSSFQEFSHTILESKCCGRKSRPQIFEMWWSWNMHHRMKEMWEAQAITALRGTWSHTNPTLSHNKITFFCTQVQPRPSPKPGVCLEGEEKQTSK